MHHTSYQSGGSANFFGVDPLDYEHQEKIKLDRKRARNRVAATRCRQKKMQRISELEDEVRRLEGQNDLLQSRAGQLRKDVDSLRQIVNAHRARGCHLDVK